MTATAAAVVAVLIGIFVVARDGDSPTVSGPEPEVTGDQSSGWTSLPSMPVDRDMSALNNPTTLWTGSDMFISSAGRSPMFNLASGTWRLTSAPPIEAVTDPITLPPVWTGREVITFMREALGRPPTRDGEVGPLVGLAYAPDTDSWRRIADVPTGRSFTVVVWTGSEVLTWGNLVGVTTYDPTDDTWTSLTTETDSPTPDPSVPFAPGAPGFSAYDSSSAWAGDELVVFPSFAGPGAAFDPTTSTWRPLPALPLNPDAMAWTGSEVMAFDGGDGQLARLRLDEDQWRIASPAPLSGRAIGVALWAGNRFVAWGGLHFDTSPGSLPPTRLSDGAAYDPATDTWEPMGAMPASTPADAGGVYAGDRLLAWGGTDTPPSLVAATWVPERSAGGAGDPDPDTTAPVQVPSTGASADDEPVAGGSPGDVEAFCAAVTALDQTDGTTDAAIAVAAFDELRRTAPAEIRDDVNLVSDTMIINNYPDAADPSMQKATLDEMNAAGARVGAYADEHCDLDE